jgi:hypothetical protein
MNDVLRQAGFNELLWGFVFFNVAFEDFIK